MYLDSRRNANAASPAHRANSRRLLLPIIGIIASAALLLLAWWIAERPTPKLPTVPSAQELRFSQEQIDTFFESEVLPALDWFETQNKVAVDRAIDRISKGLDEYREGIPAFVDDITSWGTRFGVMRRLGNDLGEKWWGDPANAKQVHNYVEGKFGQHIFSDMMINDLVEASLKQFRDDFLANQNRLHVKIKAAWNMAVFGEHELNMQNVVARVNADAAAISTKMATDSVTTGVVSFIGGFFLEETTQALVKAIMANVFTYMATSAATTSASSGGATGAGAAGGGAAGSIIGPWGTVIGIAAGIVVGMIADWWMTGVLEKKLTEECNVMITDIKTEILVGTDQAPGLKAAFIQTIEIRRSAEQQALQTNLQEVVW